MQALLQTQALKIGYPIPRQQPIVVAHNLALTLLPGQLICLLGQNGSGKSTLLRTLAGMQTPLSGHVKLNDVDIHRMSIRDRARALSIVTTERPNVGMLSGYELVALGRHPYTDWSGRLSDADTDAIHKALDAAKAHSIAEQTVMSLSDGQRQKLMIARAVAQSSQIMILDEPTAFLDLPRRVEMMRLLQQIAHEEGRGVLLSTHDFDLALRLADAIWLMADNGVIEQGAPEDLALRGAYARIFVGEGVRWDETSGAFIVAHEAQERVKLIGGDETTRIWTGRALQRIGYQSIRDIASTTQALLTIEIKGDVSGCHWQIGQDVYTSLGQMVAQMKKPHDIQ